MDRHLSKQLNAVGDELLDIIFSLSQEELNRSTSVSSWTAGQVGEHLYKSYAVIDTLNGATEPTKRPVDEKVKEVKEIFLDFNLKMQSPTAILPSNKAIDKNWLLESLKKRIELMKEVIENKDLTEICIDYKIPEYGAFTRLEWIHFNIVHTQRHIHQLKNIVKSLKKSHQ